MTTRRRHTTRLMAAGLAVGLLAGTGSPGFGIAHAQAPAATLSARDRAAFVAIWPSVQRCNDDLSTVGGDLQQASDNFSAGSTDTGSMGADALQMRGDCLTAAGRVTRLRFGAGHATAKRVKAELHAALVDLAQGANDLTQIDGDVADGDVNAAEAALNDGAGAWRAAASHMRVANSYVA